MGSLDDSTEHTYVNITKMALVGMTTSVVNASEVLLLVKHGRKSNTLGKTYTEYR